MLLKPTAIYHTLFTALIAMHTMNLYITQVRTYVVLGLGSGLYIIGESESIVEHTKRLVVLQH